MPRPADAVQLWAIPCDDPPLPYETLFAILSDEEKRRAQRFRFDGDRIRSVVARGMLRTILASRLAAEPRALEFEHGEFGRPLLPARFGGGLDFNVSHSGGWVLIGVASGLRIGVDVERERRLSDMEALIDRFFALGEARAIRARAATERKAAFFACWTRKEAYLKALGAGLHLALDSFEVDSDPNVSAAVLEVASPGDSLLQWWLWSAVPAPGYRAAVATSALAEVRSWYWSARRGIVRWEP